MTVYRPGSNVVTSLFFEEFSDVLDRVVTFIDPVFIAGDVNIHCNLLDDPDTSCLNDCLACHGFANRVTVVTHDKGHSLDIISGEFRGGPSRLRPSRGREMRPAV